MGLTRGGGGGLGHWVTNRKGGGVLVWGLMGGGVSWSVGLTRGGGLGQWVTNGGGGGGSWSGGD